MYLLEKGNFVINLFILTTLHSIEDENSTWAKYFLLGNILHLSCCYSIISKFQNLLNMDPFVNAVGGFFVFNFSDLLGRILAGIAKWPKASR